MRGDRRHKRLIDHLGLRTEGEIDGIGTQFLINGNNLPAPKQYVPSIANLFEGLGEVRAEFDREGRGTDFDRAIIWLLDAMPYPPGKWSERLEMIIAGRWKQITDRSNRPA